MRKAFLVLFASAIIAVGAACTVHSDAHMQKEADRAAEQAKEDARRAADEAKRAGEEAAEEGRRAAEDARRAAEDAQREADDARRDALNEAAEARHDGQQQAMEARDEVRSAARADRHDEKRHDRGAGDQVNLNTATAQQIAAATGLTDSVAQKIVASRPYVSKRDLVSKKVMDEPTYWRIEKHVTVMSN
jgi:DNA uptake protein ComE-like DNA-binding protein